MLLARRRGFPIAVLPAAAGAAATLLAGFPLEVARVLAAIVVVPVAWSELADSAGKAARSLDVASELGVLTTEPRAPWLRLDEVNAESARRV